MSTPLGRGLPTNAVLTPSGSRSTPKTRAKATAAEWEEGRAWYRAAHAKAAELEPFDPALAAGVIAALSPNQSWTFNLHPRDGSGWATIIGPYPIRLDAFSQSNARPIRAAFINVRGDVVALSPNRHEV